MNLALLAVLCLPSHQLPLADAAVHVLEGGMLRVVGVHLTGHVTVDSGGTLSSLLGSLVRAQQCLRAQLTVGCHVAPVDICILESLVRIRN